MLKLILSYYNKGSEALEKGASLEDIFNLPVREKIGRAKYIHEDTAISEINDIEKELNYEIDALIAGEDD